MTRFAFFLLITALSAIGVSAQAYSLDNFDLSNGVKVYEPPPPVIVAKRVGKNGKDPIDSMQYTMPPSMRMVLGSSLDGFTTGNNKVDSIIVDAAVRNQVDPVLIYATMHQESTFKERAISPKGARGLMQLMPGTAARFGVSDIFDPRQNIEGGAKYMRFLLDTFNGDVILALAGYNAGEGAVMKYGYRVPPYNETQEYVRRITKRYALMRDPDVAKRAKNVSDKQLASVQNQQIKPLDLYEREVFAVRTPDGRLQLVSQ